METRIKNLEEYGLSISIERVYSNIFIFLKAVGKLTHKNYELITPIIDSA